MFLLIQIPVKRNMPTRLRSAGVLRVAVAAARSDGGEDWRERTGLTWQARAQPPSRPAGEPNRPVRNPSPNVTFPGGLREEHSEHEHQGSSRRGGYRRIRELPTNGPLPVVTRTIQVGFDEGNSIPAKSCDFFSDGRQTVRASV